MSKKSTRRQKRRRRRRTQVSRKRLRRRTRRKRRKRTRRRKVRVQRGGGFGPLQFGLGMVPPTAAGIGRPPAMDVAGGGASGVEWRTYGTAHFTAHLRPLNGTEWWYFAQRIAKVFYQYRVHYRTAQAFDVGLDLVPGWRNTNWGWGNQYGAASTCTFSPDTFLTRTCPLGMIGTRRGRIYIWWKHLRRRQIILILLTRSLPITSESEQYL